MTIRRSLDITVDRLPLAQPFRITGHVFTETAIVIATITEGRWRGRGEAAGVYYLDDPADRAAERIEGLRAAIERGLDRDALQHALPAGGARNAIDCALWELEAQRTGQPVWTLAGLSQPRPLRTAFTLGTDAPERMRAAAAAYDVARSLKLKLSGDVADDMARVQMVREARPDCWIGVDANQGFTLEALEQLMPTLIEAGVELIEQPLPRGQEEALRGFRSPIPLAADESVQTSADIPALAGLFDVINIKLDKCGGLTEALQMVRTAQALGMEAMVGNMTGSSLAMAPGFVLGQLCRYVDLDGPTFLARDHEPSVSYSDGMIYCPETLWGCDAQPIHA